MRKNKATINQEKQPEKNKQTRNPPTCTTINNTGVYTVQQHNAKSRPKHTTAGMTFPPPYLPWIVRTRPAIGAAVLGHVSSE